MKRILLVSILLGAVAMMALCFVPSRHAQATGTPQQLYLELVQPPPGSPGRPQLLATGVPANCSTWQELYPSFGATYHQDSYTDNGDGVVSACDIIVLNGVAYHIVTAGPTYWTTFTVPGLPPQTVVYEPTQPHPGSPVCDIWHEIHPQFCDQIHVDNWQDGNGNGEVDPCDVIFNAGTPTRPPGQYHIDRVECDVTLEPVPNTPAEKSTWGSIKSFFQHLIP